MLHQPALALQLDPYPSFDNFSNEANQEIVTTLQGLLKEPVTRFLHLWGPEGSGKSHLLQALSSQAQGLGKTSLWLPLDELVQQAPATALQELDRLDILALDGLDSLNGLPDWQEALYGLYNGVRQEGGILISASRQKPDQLQLGLPDLRSRLNWGPHYRLMPISDRTKAEVLKQRARERGLELPDESLNYLLNRYSRNLKDLIGLLERLDTASLEQRRRLSLPFVRQWLLNNAPDLFC